MEFNKHFKLNSMLKYITVISFIVSHTVKAGLTPKYSDELNKIVFFDATSNEPLFLTCEPSPKNVYKIVWEKNGTNVKEIPSLRDRYQIKEDNFVIANTDFEDNGNYTCRILETNESANIEVIASAFIKKMNENVNFVEGEQIKIHCKAQGTDPEVTWKIDGKDDFNRSHVTFKDADNIKDAILLIEHAELSDQKNYTCFATNKATGFGKYVAAEAWTYVRIKAKLAALWPFLGICLEVFILCAIILVYEKRRNKEGMDESDTDQSPEQEKLKTGK